MQNEMAYFMSQVPPLPIIVAFEGIQNYDKANPGLKGVCVY
jgi:hypothetical protein